jgi:hypothetical protein
MNYVLRELALATKSNYQSKSGVESINTPQYLCLYEDCPMLKVRMCAIYGQRATSLRHLRILVRQVDK